MNNRSISMPNIHFIGFFHKFITLIESAKTTSKEDVSTGVLEKNKEYLRSKDKAKKWYDVSRHI